jgi:hypothetical protein
MKEILVPISLGELYDKLSILEIKSQCIRDENKLKNIKNELSKLNSILTKYDKDLFDQLKKTNEILWLVEDSLRDKERKKEFDDQFIDLARQVYFNNDKRSEIKKQINLKYGSTIIEEKSYQQY